MRRRPAGKVDRDPGQCLVERGVGVAEPPYTAALAQRLVDGRTQGQSTVLGRVMIVYVQVAVALQFQVEPGVLGECGQHVVEKADAALDLGSAIAIEQQLQPDGRLGGTPLHPTTPWGFLAHGTICAMLETTMSVPPRSLIERIRPGRSARGTAAVTANPASWCRVAIVGSRMQGRIATTPSSLSPGMLTSSITRLRASSTERTSTTKCSIRARFSDCSSERGQE